VSFIARDLSRFDQQAQPGTFDFITTFDAVHDQASPRNILRGIRISLADDRVYLAQDINASSDVQHNREHPIGSLLYTISCMHCMTVSLAQGGEGLGANGARRWRCSIFRKQGFTPSKCMNWPMTSKTTSPSAGLEGRRFSSRLRPQRTRAGNRR
jgi:hypothetical protein